MSTLVKNIIATRQLTIVINETRVLRVFSGTLQSAEYLLSLAKDMSVETAARSTPSHLACCNAHLAVIETLLIASQWCLY